MKHSLAHGYEKIRMQTLQGRDIEAAVLEKAAMKFRKVQQKMEPGRIDPDVDEALGFNKKIWDVLRADWQNPDSHLPRNLRENLLSLSVYVTKQMLAFRSAPQPQGLNAFIQVNENLVKGLRESQATAEATAVASV